MKTSEHTDKGELHTGDRIVLTLNNGNRVEAEIVSTDFEGDGSGVVAVHVDGVPRLVTFQVRQARRRHDNT